MPAYKAYLESAGYSQYTPDDFAADIRRFGQYMGSKRLYDVHATDLQQWVGQLKRTTPKTVSRKISALRNYFRWLQAEQVLASSPADPIRAPRVTSPLPMPLFDAECERLLAAASSDVMTYLLVLLLLETGLKTAELLELRVGDFDFSNQYQPEVWVRHSGKQQFKDRRLKLPPQVIPVFQDYVTTRGVSDTLFPCTRRRLERLLVAAAQQARVTKPVTASTLRDMFVLQSVKRGMKLDDVLTKLGLSRTHRIEARDKYVRLTREAL